MQEAADTALVNEITNHTEQRQALRWLAKELAWERTLTTLRGGEEDTVPRAA